jgi:hypothetical protein
MDRKEWQLRQENASLKIALSNLTTMVASEQRVKAEDELRNLSRSYEDWAQKAPRPATQQHNTDRDN